MKKHWLIRMSLLWLLWLLSSSCSGDAVLKETIKEEILVPYLAMVQRSEFQQAYEKYTSASYRSNNSLSDYLAHYRSLLKEKGAIREVHVNRIDKLTSVFSDSDEIRAEVQLAFDEGYYKPVLFILSRDKEANWKLDAAWHHNKYAAPDGHDGPF